MKRSGFGVNPLTYYLVRHMRSTAYLNWALVAVIVYRNSRSQNGLQLKVFFPTKVDSRFRGNLVAKSDLLQGCVFIQNEKHPAYVTLTGRLNVKAYRFL